MFKGWMAFGWEILRLAQDDKWLQNIYIRDILKPEVYFHYENTLQRTYDALAEVEDALNS